MSHLPMCLALSVSPGQSLVKLKKDWSTSNGRSRNQTDHEAKAISASIRRAQCQRPLSRRCSGVCLQPKDSAK